MTTAILPLYNGLFNGAVTFCGANGQSYAFQRFNADQDWAKVPGVVLFASQEGCTWRIIRVAEQGGAEGDVATSGAGVRRAASAPPPSSSTATRM